MSQCVWIVTGMPSGILRHIPVSIAVAEQFSVMVTLSICMRMIHYVQLCSSDTDGRR